MRKESIRTEEEKVLKRLQLDKTRRRKCRPLTMTEVCISCLCITSSNSILTYFRFRN